jgi:hypothetical protein
LDEQVDPQAIIATTISAQMRAAIAHVNVVPKLLVITEDKMWKCLTEWQGGLASHGKWIAPLSLLASLVFCFVTSTFHDALDIPKDTWRAVAMIGIAASAIWLLVALWKRMSAAISKRDSIDDLIKAMKTGAQIVPGTKDPNSQQ